MAAVKRPTGAVKKPVAMSKRPGQGSREARLRTVAKAAGLNLEKQGKGFQLVDAVTGTLVAADWSEAAAGLSLDEIEKALKG